jgi:pimeloyl-ACP methyl ester carboxylesterase
MATEATTAVPRRRFEAAGTSSRLVEAGPEDASTAVVFVHGNPGSSDDWEPLIGAVGATGTRALSFDLPDFGETIAPAGFAHTVPGYAAFVDAALAALGVERSTSSSMTSAARSASPGRHPTPTAWAA